MSSILAAKDTRKTCLLYNYAMKSIKYRIVFVSPSTIIRWDGAKSACLPYQILLPTTHHIILITR